jgi:hypothetical protein
MPLMPKKPTYARGGQPLVAELARAVRDRERHDDDVATFDAAHLGADLLDDPDRLVAHALAGLARCHRVVRPQIAAADAGADDADDRVSWLGDCRVPDALDADVAGAVHHGRFHVLSPFFVRGFISCPWPRKHRIEERESPC